MRTRSKLIILALPIALIVAGLSVFGPLMAPVKRGTAQAFWASACRIHFGNVEGEREQLRGVYAPIDGWFIYYYQGYHGQRLFKVPKEQVANLLPQVVQKLREACSNGGCRPYVAAALETLVQEERTTDAERFVAILRNRLSAALTEKHPEWVEMRLSDERDFDQRWKRAGRYWVNYVFEFLYLVGLVMFAAWPWLRRKGVWSRSIHLLSLPFLLYLPAYLGYATWSLTKIGPSGGAFYPIIIAAVPVSVRTEWDSSILSIVPQALEPLSQPQGPMISLTGGLSGIGPVESVLLVVVPVFLALVWTLLRRGFCTPSRRSASLTIQAGPPADAN